ncbi:MAG: DUF2911 domain-containing protein [Terriglobia bacterium]
MKFSASLLLPAMLLSLWALLPVRTTAQGNDRGLAQLTLGKAKVSIDYGRPTLRGRNPLSLIGPGEIWQAGADAPTTFESNADLDFDGVRVPQGEHYLVARYIERGAWSLLFSSKPAQDYEPSAKVAEVPVRFQTSKDPQDELTIRLEGRSQKGTLVISWGTLRLTGRFSVAK